jgi:hypothetical protein
MKTRRALKLFTSILLFVVTSCASTQPKSLGPQVEEIPDSLSVPWTKDWTYYTKADSNDQ